MAEVTEKQRTSLQGLGPLVWLSATRLGKQRAQQETLRGRVQLRGASVIHRKVCTAVHIGISNKRALQS